MTTTITEPATAETASSNPACACDLCGATTGLRQMNEFGPPFSVCEDIPACIARAAAARKPAPAAEAAPDPAPAGTDTEHANRQDDPALD